jgi:hypothetical protein
MQRDGTAALLRDMRSQGVMPTFPHPWGSTGAYLSLLRRPKPLALLDVPDISLVPDLPQRVHVLSRLSTVVVLVPDDTDSVSLEVISFGESAVADECAGDAGEGQEVFGFALVAAV